MSSQTTHGYVTYAPADTDATFLEFRTNIAGTSNSNFTKIDEDITSLEDRATALEGGKSPIGHTHTTSDITDFPTDVSAFNNDGDGDSPYATEDYVDENGGKIDSIKFNNVTQPITNKVVSLTESDPVFNASPAHGITNNDINAWNTAVQPQALADAVGAEAEIREAEDNSLQNQIDAITSRSDVVDVVNVYNRGTDTSKTDIAHYDTSVLATNDIVKVMQDETHSEAISYYKWSGTAWSYVGSQGPFYTKGETDNLLSSKQNTISDLATIRSGAAAGATAYQKLSDGILKADLASAVQASLGRADTALQTHQDISGKENTSNKKTSWSTTPSDTNYPSEKLVKTSLDLKFDTSKIHFVTTPPTSGGSDGDIWFVYET